MSKPSAGIHVSGGGGGPSTSKPAFYTDQAYADTGDVPSPILGDSFLYTSTQEYWVYSAHGWIQTLLAGSPELTNSGFNAIQSAAADGVNYQKTIEYVKLSFLTAISTSIESRVRVYHSEAQQAADAGRAIGVTPTGNHGVILDYVSTGEEMFDLTPGIVCDTDSNSVYVTLTNLSGSEDYLSVNFYGFIGHTGEALP